MTIKYFFLRFPFKPLNWVNDLESSYEFSIGEYQYSIRAHKPYLILKVQPFSTEEEALSFLPRLWGALAVISIDLRTGFFVEMQPDKIFYAEDPIQAAENLSKTFGLPR